MRLSYKGWFLASSPRNPDLILSEEGSKSVHFLKVLELTLLAAMHKDCVLLGKTLILSLIALVI